MLHSLRTHFTLPQPLMTPFYLESLLVGRSCSCAPMHHPWQLATWGHPLAGINNTTSCSTGENLAPVVSPLLFWLLERLPCCCWRDSVKQKEKEWQQFDLEHAGPQGAMLHMAAQAPVGRKPHPSTSTGTSQRACFLWASLEIPQARARA